VHIQCKEVLVGIFFESSVDGVLFTVSVGAITGSLDLITEGLVVMSHGTHRSGTGFSPPCHYYTVWYTVNEHAVSVYWVYGEAISRLYILCGRIH
jgi:hypothetical protein